MKEDKAIVDVDVRGWIYAPHRGPLNRKNRIVVGLARQLSGIPAPPRDSPSASNASSRPSSPFGLKDRADSNATRQEQELAFREAESIVKRGEAEAEVAEVGGYSERPTHRRGDSSAGTSAPPSRETSPERFRDDFARNRRDQAWIENGDSRRTSQLNPAAMSPAELSVANTRLMERIAPFMANPLANTTISAFFYNNDESKMVSFETDASGHFSTRTPLEFLPSHVRILASDRLSATEQIRVTEPNGVSVISDIDDTIKHSAINSGAKEIFRNVFVRDVGELSIDGVRAWYGRLANMGCEFHYVSNSPWQIYPVLSAFFKSAGLPLGSFHLKQYNGMLQGIFEPVAERKKASLDKLMKDFPGRRFLLIGDSGEADLEVYTEAVCEYPGRVLGVFIRDVTTSKRKSFFDPALGPLSGDRAPSVPPKPGRKPSNMSNVNANSFQENADLKEAIARSLVDVGGPSEAMERSLSRHVKSKSPGSPARPPLPPRRPTAPAAVEENLIDLSPDEHDQPATTTGLEDPMPGKGSLQPPPPPTKPRSLSSAPIERTPSAGSATTSNGKPPPPRPRKPSTSVHVQNSLPDTEKAPPLPTRRFTDMIPEQSEMMKSSNRQKPPAPPPPRRTYGGAARQKLTSAYSRIPSPKAMVFGSRPGTPHSSPTHSRSSSVDPDILSGPTRQLSLAEEVDNRRPPIPLRKPTGLQSNAGLEDAHLAYGSGDHVLGNNAQQGPATSKKEEAWRRRWANAKRTLDAKGVMLRSWRVGDDVQKDAVALVEAAMAEGPRGRSR